MLGGEHQVVATADPVDALRRVASGERFDLLLTDVVMPRLTGIELHARLLRCAPDLADRTLFLTGGATNPAVASFLAERPGKVIEKPCSAAALREAVAAVLTRKSVETVD
jgi:CheY-like chemotaxis protein